MSRRLSIALRAAALLVVAASAPAATLHFDEVMAGEMQWVGAPASEASRVSLHLRLATSDTEAFFADPRHPMQITGFLRVQPPAGPAADYPVTAGEFLFLAPGAGADERVMVYALEVATPTGRRFWFRGVKTLHDDQGGDMVGDTTRLASTLRRGGPEGPVVAAGELRFRWQSPGNMARFVGSFRVGGAGLWGKLVVLKRFLRLYLGTLAELYL